MVSRSSVVVLIGGWAFAGICYVLSPEAIAVMFAAALAWWVAVVVVIYSDLAEYIIPDRASAAVALIGFAQATAVPLAWGAGPGEAVLAGVTAASTGAGAFLLFWVVGLLFRKVGGRDALGFGDVKLAGASAIWLAPGDAALALEIAAFGAAALIIVARRRGAARDEAVPFGAFLAPAAWIIYVAGPAVREILS